MTPDQLCLALDLLVAAADRPCAGNEEGQEDQNSEKTFLSQYFPESNYCSMESYRFMFAECEILSDCVEEQLITPYLCDIITGVSEDGTIA